MFTTRLFKHGTLYLRRKISTEKRKSGIGKMVHIYNTGREKIEEKGMERIFVGKNWRERFRFRVVIDNTTVGMKSEREVRGGKKMDRNRIVREKKR